MSEKELTRKEIERMAQLGKGQVNSVQQRKYLDQIKEETLIRAQEIKNEENRLRAEQQEAERQANLPPMSKRMKLEAERNKTEEQSQIVNDELPPNPYKEQIDDVTNANTQQVLSTLSSLKPQTKHIAAMAPFAKGTTKERVTELPSGFLSYPQGAEIYITPYSGDDIDELSNSKLSVKYILTRCMEGVFCNFDKNDITFYDAMYLSYYRRILSIADSKIVVMSQCPYCEKYSSKEVNVNKDIEFEDIKIPSLPINVDFSFGKLSFSYLTYGDYMKIQTDLRSEELAYQCINEVETDKDQSSVDKLREVFGKATGEDAELLREVRKMTYHGIKPIQTLCQNKDCGQTYETFINEWDSVILPFRQSTDTLRTKISFG